MQLSYICREMMTALGDNYTPDQLRHGVIYCAASIPACAFVVFYCFSKQIFGSELACFSSRACQLGIIGGGTTDGLGVVI